MRFLQLLLLTFSDAYQFYCLYSVLPTLPHTLLLDWQPQKAHIGLNSLCVEATQPTEREEGHRYCKRSEETARVAVKMKTFDIDLEVIHLKTCTLKTSEPHTLRDSDTD